MHSESTKPGTDYSFTGNAGQLLYCCVYTVTYVFVFHQFPVTIITRLINHSFYSTDDVLFCYYFCSCHSVTNYP